MKIDYFRGKKFDPTSPIVNEELSKIEVSTDICHQCIFLWCNSGSKRDTIYTNWIDF